MMPGLNQFIPYLNIVIQSQIYNPVTGHKPTVSKKPQP